MCIYCTTLPYSPYYQGFSYGYPYAGYGFPYYGLPLGYSYPYPAPVAAPVVAAAPALPRGEHRVGNCLCICQ